MTHLSDFSNFPNSELDYAYSYGKLKGTIGSLSNDDDDGSENVAKK